MKRYPGVSPFSTEQREIFFGREKDIDRLSKLIFLRNQVLLYSKSGIGKTSLLNAGVLPNLESKVMVIRIRFFAYNELTGLSPVQRILETVHALVSKNAAATENVLSEISKNIEIEKSVWFELKKLQYSSKKPFLLVFDQFEELFSYPELQIKEFKELLYELLYVEIPDSFMQFLARNPEIESHPEIDFLYDPIDVKTLIAIRSDRISLLNRLIDKLPEIQKFFYELRPLKRTQAIEAIVSPAKKKGRFETPTFELEESALKKTINALSNNEEQDIEATQLQIVCQRLENIAKAKSTGIFSRRNILIEEKDLPEFRDMFLEFYYNVIYDVDKNKQLDTREFVENQLIRNKQRISLDERVCLDYVDRKTLNTLINSHLLRAEPNSTGSVSYEISHDILVNPILASRRNRENLILQRAQEEKQRLEKLINDKQKEIQLQSTEIKRYYDNLLEELFYSQTIMNALLPSDEYFKEILPDAFVMVKSKSVIGGDFYWVRKIENKIYFTIADSTGHGFPGAMLSIIGLSMLRHLFLENKHYESNEVLEALRMEFIDILKQRNKQVYLKDGIDMGFGVFETESLKIQYSGAYIPLVIIRDGEIIQLNRDRIPIGLYGLETSYSKHDFQLQKNDSVYMYTDGFIDQFGGPDLKKFRNKPLKRLLLSIQNLSMDEQKEVLEKTFTDWKGTEEQTDDMAFLGFRV